MRPFYSQVVRATDCQSIATIRGLIPTSSDKVESEGWQIKQCSIWYNMKRFDQGHLYSKLEVPRLTCPGEHSRKETFEQLLYYIWACDHGECSQHGSPQCMCYVNTEHTWTHLNALGCRPNIASKASARHLPAAKTSGTCKSEYSLSSRTDHVGVTTMKSIDQGHLRPIPELPKLTCPSWELNPGLHGVRRALQKRDIQTACLQHLHKSAPLWRMIVTTKNSSSFTKYVMNTYFSDTLVYFILTLTLQKN